MISLRRFAAALALTLGFAAPASAVTGSPDFTDLWYNAAESGWGITFTHQGSTVFAAMYVYGTDGTPRWFVATQMVSQPAGSGQFKFGGTLYSTTGTYFGTTPFNPGQTVVTPVGNMAITFSSTDAGTLIYNVGDVQVTKPIVRQAFAAMNVTGTFIGAGMTTQLSACANSTGNGDFAHFLGNLTATQTGTAVTFRMDTFDAQATVCNFAGQLASNGRYGSITGIWSCVRSNAVLNTGTFTITQLDTQLNGMTGKIVAVDQFCTYSGNFGGLRGLGT